MFDLGDELIIGSHRLPWLLWIQLLVMLLLIILLYYTAIFVFGVDPAVSSSQPPLATASATTSRVHNLKVGGNGHSITAEEGTSTSTRRVRRDYTRETGGSSTRKDASSVSGGSYHPCSFIGLAKQAFLRCLGLDMASEDSSTNTSRRKED